MQVAGAAVLQDTAEAAIQGNPQTAGVRPDRVVEVGHGACLWRVRQVRRRAVEHALVDMTLAESSLIQEATTSRPASSRTAIDTLTSGLPTRSEFPNPRHLLDELQDADSTGPPTGRH